jgi:hypothetical protein
VITGLTLYSRITLREYSLLNNIVGNMEQYHSATAAYRVPTSSSISDMDPEK